MQTRIAQLEEEIQRLYERQKQLKPDEYIDTHSRNTVAIRNRINSYLIYKKYLGSTILDWGCRHALDSCIIRMDGGDRADICGCDTCNSDDYQAFHGFANLQYHQISDPIKVPYANEQFDTIIGAGVIEHVPNDMESLKEMWRILKAPGHLILTYVPNAFSYTEFTNRSFGKLHHKRRYTVKEIKNRLLHTGFVPVFAWHHQMIPSQLRGFSFRENPVVAQLIQFGWRFNDILERLWLVNCFSTNLIIVAQKVDVVP
jgi:SAM-dependent methyltransferase